MAERKGGKPSPDIVARREKHLALALQLGLSQPGVTKEALADYLDRLAKAYA
jgi:hypothetical protein